MSIFYGEHGCAATDASSTQKCDNKTCVGAQDTTAVFCKVHGRGKPDLPQNPRAAEIKAESARAQVCRIETHKSVNVSLGLNGNLTVGKLGARQTAPVVPGALSVFPNFRGRTSVHGDTLGLPGLSPTVLGPVIVQGVYPSRVAATLEAFFQAAKVYPFLDASFGDADPAETLRPKWHVNPSFFASGHAHAYAKADFKAAEALQAVRGPHNVDVKLPLFAVYLDSAGAPRRFTHIASRWFYCKAYEQLARRTAAYRDLLARVRAGVDVHLLGYDGYPPTRLLFDHYVDPTRPFGHELVLYTLLAADLAADPPEHPWDAYHRLHAELYTGFPTLFAAGLFLPVPLVERFRSGTSHLSTGAFPLSKEDRESLWALPLVANPTFKMMGKDCTMRRSMGFFSDVVPHYPFSNQKAVALPVPPFLKALLKRVNALFPGADFNAMLVNVYADGSDYISHHCDKNTDAQEHGVVALSLGAERRFVVKEVATKKVFELKTQDQQLLQMGGARFQKDFTHGIPKESRVKSPRLSVTFRRHPVKGTKRKLDA